MYQDICIGKVWGGDLHRVWTVATSIWWRLKWFSFSSKCVTSREGECRGPRPAGVERQQKHLNMCNPYAGQPGPSPHPPSVGCPGGTTLCTHLLSISLSSRPQAPPLEHSLLWALFCVPARVSPRQPSGPCPSYSHHLLPLYPLAPGTVRPGIRMDKTWKKMRTFHRKMQKQHKHGKHSSSGSDSGYRLWTPHSIFPILGCTGKINPWVPNPFLGLALLVSPDWPGEMKRGLQ